MCNGDKACEPCKLKANKVRYETLDGEKYLVVPVVMAIPDVVMNEALLPVEEYFAPAWNGVPVTVGHPDKDGDFLSANTPEGIKDWSVGRIFNTIADDEGLRAEAWVSVAKANKIHPGLIKHLEAEKPLDVSTGFYSDAELISGVVNGREYEFIHRNVRPDHLALLPDENGACSFSDGCGVRANNRWRMALNKLRFMGRSQKTPVKNAGATDQQKTMVAQLVASGDAPFSAKDMDALMAMSEETVSALHGQYLGGSEEEADEGNEPEKVDDEVEDPKEEKGSSMNKKQIEEIVANAVTAAVGAALKNVGLSSDDRLAINAAARIAKDHRDGIIEKITANSAMTKEFCDKLDLATLEGIAAGLPDNSATFIGRALPSSNSSGDDDAAKDMEPTGVVALIRNANKKG